MTSVLLPRVEPVEPLGGPFGCALTVDVEEWYHTCHVPEYVDPAHRPVLVEELDWLLPAVLERFARAGRQATFFVLGEVAQRLPARIREIAAAGHEVASHGHLHLRAGERSPADFAEDVRDAKVLLEDLLGVPVDGYRAPEWSLRDLGSTRLPLVARAGYRYDSSLAPYPLAGHLGNPRTVTRLVWPDCDLLELPPLSIAGALRLPAGSWTGRLTPPRWIAQAAARHQAAGGLPVWVVHPWELTGRATPGSLHGLARFVHETGRLGYVAKFEAILAALPWTSLKAAVNAAGVW